MARVRVKWDVIPHSATRGSPRTIPVNRLSKVSGKFLEMLIDGAVLIDYFSVPTRSLLSAFSFNSVSHREPPHPVSQAPPVSKRSPSPFPPISSLRQVVTVSPETRRFAFKVNVWRERFERFKILINFSLS